MPDHVAPPPPPLQVVRIWRVEVFESVRGKISAAPAKSMHAYVGFKRCGVYCTVPRLRVGEGVPLRSNLGHADCVLCWEPTHLFVVPVLASPVVAHLLPLVLFPLLLDGGGFLRLCRLGRRGRRGRRRGRLPFVRGGLLPRCFPGHGVVPVALLLAVVSISLVLLPGSSQGLKWRG